ncbi:MAG: STAS domain-containing protein [Fibrobacterota bacterium]
MNNIYITKNSGICRIKMAGEADIDFVNAFSATASEIESSKEDMTLVVDLADVTYIDSASLGIFVKLIKIYQKKKKQIILFKPRPSIEELFGLTGLSRFLLICKSEADLETAIRQKQPRKKKKKRA